MLHDEVSFWEVRYYMLKQKYDSLKQFNKIINDNRNDENFAKLNKSH